MGLCLPADKSNSLYDNKPLPTQPSKQLQHGQSKNRKMIAIDTIEQMDAESLDLVNPDARKNGGTGEVEISGDFRCVQTAHLEIGHIILSKQGLPVASDAHG